LIKKRADGYVKNVIIGKNQDKLKQKVKIIPIIKDNQKLMHIQHDRSFPNISFLM
jgi:hypothetical protein